MMALKKSDMVSTAADNIFLTGMESIPAGSFVTTFWDQYEKSSERVQQMQGRGEDAYFNALKEVIKFNKEYRNTIVQLYEQTKRTNKDVVTELLHQFNASKEALKEEIVHTSDREELKQQLTEVTGQMEKLALTPIRSIFHIVNQLEDNFENNVESNAEYARVRRSAWFEVSKEYVKKARNAHLDFVERSQNSLNELMKFYNY